jgi:outer membrane protein assembly factor BamB
MSVLLATLTLLGVVLVEGPSHHVQGIDVEGGILWVTSVDRTTRTGFLTRYDVSSGRRLVSVEIHDGARFHPGGLQIDGDSVWVPVAEYRRDSSTWIERRDKVTLALLARFEVADHIGCVAVADGVIWGGNWDSRHLYRWRLDGTLIDKRTNPTGSKYQDIKIVDGLLVASGLGGPDKGAIDWVDPTTLAVTRRIVTGATDRGVPYTNEGMTVRGESLYLLPEDDPSRLFHYRLP